MKEMTIAAAPESIAAVTDFVNEQLDALGCPMKAMTQIDIAIDELLSNIARYAYAPGTGNVTVRFEVQPDPLSVVITFIDQGVPFDPLSAAIPDITLSAQERSIGGLGIFMVRKTMDEISYRYDKGCNILTIRKKLRS